MTFSPQAEAMLVEILESAIEAPHGILVATGEPARLRQNLYILKRERPESYGAIQARIVNLPDGQLAVYRQGTHVEARLRRAPRESGLRAFGPEDLDL